MAGEEFTTGARRAQRTPRTAELIAVAAAATAAAAFLFVAVQRVAYPYDIDFIEDSMLMQAWRFAQGLPVYGPPNADFNPHIYMPLYTWLGGLLLRLTGPSFVPLRLLSLGATLATAVMLFAIARQLSGAAWLGAACAGLFLGGYRITGFWYDLARVDALFVALSVGGLALGLGAGRSTARQSLAALVLALAFFAKQTALLFAAGVGAYLLFTEGRRALAFAGPYAALALAPLLALDATTGGWFFYHVFAMAALDPLEPARLVHYLTVDLFGLMGGLSLCALAVALLVLRPLRGSNDRGGLRAVVAQPWLPAIALGAALSAAARTLVGGDTNTLMPVYALLCLAPALLWREWRWPQRAWALAALVVVQLALGVYNPPRYVPAPAQRAAGDRLIARLAAEPGPVLVLMHPYYALLAGKAPATQIATLWYVRARGAQPLPADFVARIASRYYGAIVSDESLFETEPALQALLLAHYAPAETLGPDDAPATMAGMVVRPVVVYRPAAVTPRR
jgi:hypothetical protein